MGNLSKRSDRGVYIKPSSQMESAKADKYPAFSGSIRAVRLTLIWQTARGFESLAWQRAFHMCFLYIDHELCIEKWVADWCNR